MDNIKYPEVVVKLTGTNGNAFSILGKVRNALRDNDVPKEEIDKFFAEATSGDYDHLIVTAMKWVTVE